jgi:hypothetical protein
VFTRPPHLAEEVITDILRRRWGLGPVDLDYLPVGFGSHHWRATDATGRALFLSIDDLHKSQTSTPDGTLDAAHERLARAYRSAYALRHRGGLDFVVAPVADRDGLVIARVSEHYSMIVQPHLSGQSLGSEDFVSWTDRAEVVGILARLHGATDVVRPEAGIEVGFLPGRDELLVALDAVGTPWTNGPYGQQARALLDRHAAAVEGLLDHCERGAVLVTEDPDTMVLTHGEPTASNTMLTPSGFALVDWESALLAPPERDLWVLDPGDGSICAAYTAATGTPISIARIDWYRLWYDLFEIAGYIDLFREPHEDTTDAAESWKNLLHFLQPDIRWPDLAD